MLSCSLCGELVSFQKAPAICDGCDRALTRCELDGFEMDSTASLPYPRLSLWKYRGAVRQAILNFKVGGQWSSGSLLAHIAGHHSAVQDWMQGIEAVMPMPSSFWSRLRGRFDLADHTAHILARQHQLPLIQAPLSWQGRWTKQALRPRRDRQEKNLSKMSSYSLWTADRLASACMPRESLVKRPLRLLVVDDIVTSGESLRTLIEKLQGFEVQILTLASAIAVQSDS